MDLLLVSLLVLTNSNMVLVPKKIWRLNSLDMANLFLIIFEQ